MAANQDKVEEKAIKELRDKAQVSSKESILALSHLSN
jgi:hypothetical protein